MAPAFQCRAQTHRFHQRRLEEDYSFTDKVLGHGANGDVKLAVARAKIEGKRCVAVKSISLVGLSPAKLQQAREELSILLECDHPNIVRLLEVYETSTHLHLVMECLCGGELFERVCQRRRLSQSETARVSRQVIAALRYLHGRGFVHRDVKLENFVFENRDSEHLKLIDFGLSARWKEASRKLTTRCGTLEYAAPEVLRGNYARQCDLWSAGVMCYTMLSGDMPWSSKDPDIRQKIHKGHYNLQSPSWSGISSVTKDFVWSLLRVDPSKRLTAATALEHPFLTNEIRRPEPHSLAVLCAFAKAPELQRSFLQVIAWNLTSEEQAAAREQFLIMDSGARGCLSSGDVEALILENAQAEDAACLLQLASCQSFTYSEFLAAMASAKINPSSESLAAAFRRFAAPNGSINEDSLEAIIGGIQGCSAEGHLPQASGSLDFKGFTEYLARARSVSQSTALWLCGHFQHPRLGRAHCGEVASLHTSKAIEEAHRFMEKVQSPKAAKPFRTRVLEEGDKRSCLGFDVDDACSIQ